MTRTFLASLAALFLSLVAPAARADDRISLAAALGLSHPLGTPEPGLEGRFGTVIPFAPHVGLDVLGAAGASGDPDAGRAWARLAAGLRGWWAFGDIAPYGALRVSHVHDGARSSWDQHFGDNALGDPSHGLMHTTALGGAVGATYRVGRRWSLFVEVDASAVVHPGGHDPAAPGGWAGLAAGLSVEPW